MIPYNRVYRESRKTFVNGVLTSEAMNQLLRDNVFSVNGFGNGNFIDPTAGSLSKTTRQLMTGSQYHVSATGATKTLIVGPHPSLGIGQGFPPPTLTAQETTNLQNRVLEKLYAKVRGDHVSQGQGTQNAGVTVGESRETYRMVEGAAKAARHVSEWAKKAVGAVTRKGKIVGSVASAWLAYQYGWKPLLSDIHGFAEWTSRHFRERTFRATGHVRRPYVDIRPYSGYENVSVTSIGFHDEAWLYSITCEVSDQEAFDLDRLTSMDPKRITWELLPLSFVLDWFVDIGGYLGLQEAALGRGLTFKRGFSTRSTLNYYECTVKGADKSSSTSELHMFDYMAKRRVATKSRVVLNGFPRPAFPTVKVDLGVARILSGGALLATALGAPNHPVRAKARAARRG